MPELDPDTEVLIGPKQIRDRTRPPYHRIDAAGEAWCGQAAARGTMERRPLAECPDRARLCGHCAAGGSAHSQSGLAAVLSDPDVSDPSDLEAGDLVTDGGHLATKACRGCGYSEAHCECEDGDRDG
jgi:hypothetical protein